MNQTKRISADFPAMLIGIVLLLTACACSKSSPAGGGGTGTTPVDPAAQAISVYPVPPSQWMQTNGVSYYSAGWVGDVMPYFDNGKFHVFYLHDARDGQAGFHPIHKFETVDMVHFDYKGLMVNYAGKEDQDLAIGTGSVVKSGDTYYCYYTGHNYLFPASSKPKEGVMYATSKDLNTWTKKTGFNLTAPIGYDRNEFRDPYVFFNTEKNEYWMLVSARTNNRAVINLFTTTDPAADNWQSKGPLFTTDNTGYYMMECPDLFKWGNKWYLFFSENNIQKTTHYRVAGSSDGPFTKPEVDVIDGEYQYAAKTAGDGTRRYAFGWTATKQGKTDAGNKEWAGNLVVHQLKQNTDGSISVQTPDAVASLFKVEKTFSKAGGTGEVVQSGADVALKPNSNIFLDRITGQKKITTTVSGVEAGAEFGFLFGAASASSNDYYRISIREAEDRTSVVHFANGGLITESTVPFRLDPGKDYQLKIIIDNNVCVIYLDDTIALSARIYGLPGSYWGLYSLQGNVNFKNLKLYDY